MARFGNNNEFQRKYPSEVNLLTIITLSRGKSGLSRCITRYLVAMATADLSVIVCKVTLHQIAAVYWWDSFLFYTPLCKLILFLSTATVDCSVWFTVAFTFDRCVAISTQKLARKYCTERTALVVLVTLSAIFCFKNIPWPFAYVSYFIRKNISWGCLILQIFYALPEWVAFSWTDQLLTPVIPFCLIVLLNALTVRRILVSNRVRKSLRESSSEDPEMVNRRRSIILLLAISGTFILLWATSVAYFIYYRAQDSFLIRGYIRRYTKFERSATMLQMLSCCSNTFIYTATQRQFRKDLFYMLKYPFTRIISSVK
ncbi:probable G-protein coupled receptor 139 [Hypanus sabinus]|uniref:probable G-protein coupled receptor 139 n=1 Tax=Hypanus sabinus TaxID=79690 RepID=UPI0028C38F7B|nr:probable G-protein coupled receptor 139 [Hypanus sabinus]